MEMESIKEKGSGIAEESELRNKSITNLFWKYSLFALAGLAVQSLQVIADGNFVGNGIGPIGLAVVGITGSFWQLAIALMGLFGIGGSTLAAVKLGEGDFLGAKKVYGSILTFSFVFTVILSALIIFNLDSALTFIGATSDVLPSAREYSIIFLIGLPFVVSATVAYYFTRISEKPFIALLAYVLPAIIAIIVEYIGIYKLGLGIKAASLATTLCLALGVFLLPYLQFGKTPFKLVKADLKVDFKIIFEVCKVGFAMFIIPFSTMAVIIVTNNMIIKSGGSELHLAAYGVFTYVAYLLSLVTIAFVTGIQPIASYNMGAKLYGRVRKIITTGIVQSSVTIMIVLLIVYLCATPINQFFTGPDPVLLKASIEGMKIYVLLYAFGNISQIVSGYFMAVEKSGFAILNAIARMVIFVIPLIFILSPSFGVKGVWMSQPGADALSFILAMICIYPEYRRLGKLEAENTLNGQYVENNYAKKR